MNEDTKKSFAAILAAAQAKANVKTNVTFTPVAKIAAKQEIKPIEVPKVEVITQSQQLPEMSTMTFADLVNDTTVPVIEKPKVEIKEYSDKSFAVFGETYPLRNKLREMGGTFNYHLKGGAGWIFSKSRYDAVKSYLENAA